MDHHFATERFAQHSRRVGASCILVMNNTGMVIFSKTWPHRKSSVAVTNINFLHVRL